LGVSAWNAFYARETNQYEWLIRFIGDGTKTNDRENVVDEYEGHGDPPNRHVVNNNDYNGQNLELELWVGDTNKKAWVNGNLWWEEGHNDSCFNTILPKMGGAIHANATSANEINVDYVFIRKCIFPQPSFQSASNEELNINNWQYRKKITIQGQSNAGENYQVLLKVGESSNSLGCDFHLEGKSANFPNVNDNFDDNILNNYLWQKKISGNNVSLEEQNGRIEASVTATSGTNFGYLESKFYLSGDFDIQIDFSNLDLENKDFTFARGLDIYIDSNNYAYCQLQYADWSGRVYHGAIKVNGSETYDDIATDHTSGKFRAIREGQKFTWYIWNGTNWQQVHQRTDFPTKDVSLRICWVYNTNNCGQISVYFDNFRINKGTILKPLSGDIRFTSSDETTNLNFWIEKVEGTFPNRVAHIWVKILDNLDNDVDIYCYYGNPNASNASSGESTFIFFDDFNGTDIDTNKWDFEKGSQGNGNYSVNRSTLTWTYLPFGIKHSHNSLSNATLRARYYVSNPTPNGSGLVWDSFSQNKMIFQIWRDNRDLLRLFETDQTVHDVGNNLTSWGILELIKDQNDNIKICLNGIQQNGSYVNTYELDRLRVGNYGESGSYNTADFKFDWILIRKYVEPEPSFKSILNIDNWQYRKKITIQGQSNAGNNYQVLLKIGESAGATECDFHVENHSEKFPTDINDSGDLRFTKSDGSTLLDFWIEKVEGTTPNRIAYTWVKIPESLDNDVDIYCYYGNPNAENVSNGDKTFIFYDDFNYIRNFDSEKWDKKGSGTVNKSYELFTKL